MRVAVFVHRVIGIVRGDLKDNYVDVFACEVCCAGSSSRVLKDIPLCPNTDGQTTQNLSPTGRPSRHPSRIEPGDHRKCCQDHEIRALPP